MNLIDIIIKKLMLLSQSTIILKRYYFKSKRFKTLFVNISFLSKIKKKFVNNTDEKNFKFENVD